MTVSRGASPGPIRLTGGAWSGTRIFSPPGRVARPALAKVRAAIFNVLGAMEGARVLDLYAGTAALSFEALSRGAASATVFEQDAACLSAIRASASKLKCEPRLRVLDGDVAQRLVEVAGEGADLAFADPPYAFIDEPEAREKFRALLSRLKSEGALRNGAWLVVEHRSSAELNAPSGFTPDEVRKYGQTALSFFTAQP
ncbi:MAG: 16S rRNA (guanine(966)-N(2))-methyltransferase RsmD [Planctomycetota bacterium]